MRPSHLPLSDPLGLQLDPAAAEEIAAKLLRATDALIQAGRLLLSAMIAASEQCYAALARIAAAHPELLEQLDQVEPDAVVGPAPDATG